VTILYQPEDADILATDCEVVVIPTNCVGATGKGLAEEAARRFRGWTEQHRTFCQRAKPKPGSVIVYGEGIPEVEWPVHYLYALATKDHWRNPSRIEWVEAGLVELERTIRITTIMSIAIPALGCGTRTGQLDWSDVRPLIVASAERMSARGVRVELYPPQPEHDAAPRGRR